MFHVKILNAGRPKAKTHTHTPRTSKNSKCLRMGNVSNMFWGVNSPQEMDRDGNAGVLYERMSRALVLCSPAKGDPEERKVRKKMN